MAHAKGCRQGRPTTGPTDNGAYRIPPNRIIKLVPARPANSGHLYFTKSTLRYLSTCCCGTCLVLGGGARTPSVSCLCWGGVAFPNERVQERGGGRCAASLKRAPFLTEHSRGPILHERAKDSPPESEAIRGVLFYPAAANSCLYVRASVSLTAAATETTDICVRASFVGGGDRDNRYLRPCVRLSL